MRPLLLLALFLFVAPAAASDADALRKSGLLGTWAQDCAAPPGEDNWFDSYAIEKDGRVTETLANAPDKTYRVYELHNVKIVSADRIAYAMMADSEMLDIVVQFEGKRQRSWSSRVQGGGKAYITDGKLVAGGSETIWFNKCAK